MALETPLFGTALGTRKAYAPEHVIGTVWDPLGAQPWGQGAQVMPEARTRDAALTQDSGGCVATHGSLCRARQGCTNPKWPAPTPKQHHRSDAPTTRHTRTNC